MTPAPRRPELVLLMGLQGSGKSSFARRFAASHRILCKDAWPNHRRPRRRLLREAREHLEAGASVVADGTHPGRRDRAELLALAREIEAHCFGYFLSSPLRPCLERNRRRSGRARVPDVALFSTIKTIERPRRDEGFDALYFVRIAERGGFEVFAWEEP